jgi:hypothetical protein
MGAQEHDVDPESDAVWTALRVAVESARAQLELDPMDRAEELDRELRNACAGTPLGVGGERAEPLRTRDAYVTSCVDDLAVRSGRNSFVMEYEHGGVVKESPVQRDAKRAYRRYALKVRCLELGSAAKIGRVLQEVVEWTRSRRFAGAREGSARVETALHDAMEPLRAYAESTQRMRTVRRLGGYAR